MAPWDPTNPNHQPSDMRWDASSSRWMADGQMTWLLKRVCGHINLIFLQELTLGSHFPQGEEVVEGQILKGSTCDSVNINPSDRGNWTHSVMLYYSNAAVPPGRRDDPGVTMLCSLTFAIPYSEIHKQPTYWNEGKQWAKVYYSRDILCGGAALDYRVIYGGQMLQSVEANYVEDV